MSRARYPRSNCCVPFCPRWSTLFPAEWLCGEHWRLVDRRLRRLGRRAWRRGSPAAELFWVKIKAQAIERAAAIG